MAAAKGRVGALVFLLALVLAGAVLIIRAPVRAAAEGLVVTGTLGFTTDARMVVDDGSRIYYLVSAIPLTPYVGKRVVLGGDYDGETLFVQELTLGDLHAQFQGTGVNLSTSGIVAQAGNDFQVTVEGVAFTLIGSNELGQVVGETADIEGELLFDVLVSLTRLSTAEGPIEILPPPSHDYVPPSPDPDPLSWADE